MRKGSFAFLAAILLLSTNCAFYSSEINLQKVAQNSGLKKVTTGDGEYEDYEAVGHYVGKEFGIGIGFPASFKLFEILPIQSKELLLTKVSKKAAEAGADAMINVTPHQEFFSGFPFLFIGIYMDRAAGTGIKQK